MPARSQKLMVSRSIVHYWQLVNRNSVISNHGAILHPKAFQMTVYRENIVNGCRRNVASPSHATSYTMTHI